MLDVRKLLLLRELALRDTIAAVAEALCYTPSAVSQQLAALERDAGVPLLRRTGLLAVHLVDVRAREPAEQHAADHAGRGRDATAVTARDVRDNGAASGAAERATQHLAPAELAA